MNNQWETIPLDDYENHMKLESILQLQTLNNIMEKQFNQYSVSSIMILGIAGGNGLNHIDTDKIQNLYGIDINSAYLTECVNRFPNLKHIFTPLRIDLQGNISDLPKSDIVVANLVIEYIGYKHLQRVIQKVTPRYLSCTIQVNMDKDYISDSPYLPVFDSLDQVHQQITEPGLASALNATGYKLIYRDVKEMPNHKQLLRLDYKRL